MNRRSGFSIVELLAVVAIVGVLVAVSALVVAPRMKRSAAVAEAKNHLKQLAYGVNMYMADNDGRAPIELALVAKGIPDTDPMGGPWLYSWDQRWHGVRGADWSTFGFIEARDPIVRASRVHDHKGKIETMVYRAQGKTVVQHVPILDLGEKLRLLGARLDGSIGWFVTPGAWEENVPGPPAPLPAPR